MPQPAHKSARSTTHSRSVADKVTVSDAVKFKIIHVAPKATATEIAKSLRIGKATTERARALVDKARGDKFPTK